MELSTTYILSQVFSTIGYILLGSTYYLKTRKNILIVSLLVSIFLITGYIFLGQYQGAVMNFIGIVTNILFFIDEQKNGKSDKILKKDIIMLIGILGLTLILSILTYSNLLSLLSVFAFVAWLFSVWVKQVKIYKLIGIFSALLWLGFNIYAQSISGIITEIILVIVSTSGYILEIKSNKNKEN